MTPSNKPQRFQRRPFWHTAAGFAWADDLPQNTNPRAIFGDAVEPDWEQRVMLTVGPEKADLVGATDKVIQAAVDYVARRGGGTVHVLPGTYRLRNSIFLQSNIRLLGSGTESVLFKVPSVTTQLIVDGDHWSRRSHSPTPSDFKSVTASAWSPKTPTARAPTSSSEP